MWRGMRPAPGPGCVIPASLRLADYSVTLAAPLGTRVLLTPFGPGTPSVLPVIPP